MELHIFEIDSNRFLKYPDNGYYSIDFYSYAQTKILSFLHRLKNRYENESESMLNKCKDKAKDYIVEFLLTILKKNSNDDKIIVCRIPRSKVDFKENRLYFQKAVREAITNANQHLNNRLVDGIDYIKRIESVATTHLASVIVQDKMPYPNITKDTCEISDKITNQTIILIDDIYTIGVNVVEDCIQALYDRGAKQVIFYAVGRTVKYDNTPSTKIIDDFILNPFNKDNVNSYYKKLQMVYRSIGNRDNFNYKISLKYKDGGFKTIYLNSLDEFDQLLGNNWHLIPFVKRNGICYKISSHKDIEYKDHILFKEE